MQVSLVRCVLMVCAFLAAASVAVLAQSGSMNGTWAGRAAQNEGSSGYSVVLELTAGGGSSHYPELKCSGRLTRAGTANGYVFFSETITEGRDQCIDGTVTLKITGKTLAWGWVGVDEPSGEIIVAWSNLVRR